MADVYCFSMSGRDILIILKIQIIFSITNQVNYSHTIAHLYDKNVKKLFYQNIRLSCYFWHRKAPFLKFWNQNTNKVVFWIFQPSLQKISKWTLKSQNSKIWAEHANSILMWVQKDIWVEDILSLEVWVMGVYTYSSGYELLPLK